MMEWLTVHWLTTAVCIYLIAMTAYGYYRGIFKIMLSISLVLISLIFSNIATPYIGKFLKENTSLQQDIKRHIVKGLNLQNNISNESMESPDVNAEISLLSIPEDFKKALLKGNDNRIWEKLGTNKLTEYIGQYTSQIIINIACCLIVFILSMILLHLLIGLAKLFEKIPAAKGVDRTAGAVAGFVQGMILLWVAGLVVSVSLGSNWGKSAYGMISNSMFLSFLYKYNLLTYIFRSIFY